MSKMLDVVKKNKKNENVLIDKDSYERYNSPPVISEELTKEQKTLLSNIKNVSFYGNSTDECTTKVLYSIVSEKIKADNETLKKLIIKSEGKNDN